MESDTEELLTSRDVLLGIFALLLEERELRSQDREEARRVELPLHEIGLDYRQIGLLVNKSPDAVRMAIARA